MKNIVTILILSLAFLSCKAQSPIFPLEHWNGEEQQYAYYKDLNNELDNYVGTWLYTNGTTSLKIVLKKKTMHLNQIYSQDHSKDYYEDVIFGEYQYIENGVEKINTLGSANQDLGYDHQIWGNIIYDDDCEYMPATDCINGEKRLSVSIIDPVTDKHSATALLHKRTVTGQEALNAYISFNYAGIHNSDNPAPSPTMPWQGEYLLIKQ